MLYDTSTSSELHSWLVKTLEPICDAEPEALATYIIALLKNDVPESDLRNEVVKQLDEFFENGATAFVDTLFAALRSKSYVPYSSTPATYDHTSAKPQDIGIPIPLDLFTSPLSTSPEGNRKRSHEDDDRDARGPPKGPRLGNDAYFNRNAYANGSNQSDNWHRTPMDGPRGDFNTNGVGPRQNGRVMLPRGVCRDYHLKGFCSRGAMCKYSHDDAAITPQVPFSGPSQMGGVGIPFMPMYGGIPFGMNGMPGQTYDPSEPQMDMRNRQTQQHAPTMARADGDPYNAGMEPPVIQDLTPASTQPSVANGSHPMPSGSAGESNDVRMHSPPAQQHQTTKASASSIRPQRGGNRGRGRGGRGAFADHPSFGNQNENKTIVVEKVPEEHLSLEAVNNWFKRFGTVTNVAVDNSGGKALVSFSTHDEAYAAWKAEEAVFNNRFVKIFWHRPMAGQGSVGSKALQDSAPLVATLASREPVEAQETPKLATPATPAPSMKPKPKPPQQSLNALQAKQQLLEKQIAEQKELMAKLSKATPEEKKELMARLRKLDSEMKVPSTPVVSTPSITSEDDKEKKKRMLLDMELDMHAKATAEDVPSESGEQSSESLQEKLARLREEAKALGITELSAPAYAPPYRGFRGRGRGRGLNRGMRGAPLRPSNMRLDNRPKALLVKGLSAQNPEVVQSVRAFYEAVAPMSSLDVLDDESLVARFNSRAVAEQALAKGSNVPSVGTVKISWFSDTQPTKPAISTPTSEQKSSTFADDRPLSPRHEEIPEVHDVHLHDDSGWGDEEGMGMF